MNGENTAMEPVCGNVVILYGREAVRRLGDQVCVLHMKDFVPQPDAPRPRPVPCGQGHMRYEGLLKLACGKNLPMTLENTTPDNAEATRRWLEGQVK